MEIFYTVLLAVSIVLIGYVIGSIPTALIVGKAKGIDVRKYGSHNAGGTNVGRVIGKKWGIGVMILDILKCYIPCLILTLILTFAPLDVVRFAHFNEFMVALLGVSISFGHSFTCFAKFHGGKAVATFSGYASFVSPIVFILGCCVFFSVLAIRKRVSLSSILAAPSVLLFSFVPAILDWTVLPLETQWNGGMIFAGNFLLHLSYVTCIAMLVVVLLIVIRHTSNIKRLKAGTEPETHFRKD